MKQKLKEVLSSLVVLPLLFSLGVSKQYLLPSSTNVEKLEMIRVVGIDKEEDGIHLSLAAATPQDEGTESNFLIEGKGSTFYDAVEDAQKMANKALFWGHADIMVLGKDAAEDNTSKYVDFLARDSKTRFSMKVMAVKNGTAEELLKRKGSEEQSIFEGLSEQLRNLKDLSYATEVTMSDLIDSSGDERSSYLIPAAKMEGDTDYEIAGAGVLMNGKVVEFLDNTQSRAANLVRGNFSRGVDVLRTTLLGRISLEADDSRVRIRFEETPKGVRALVSVTLIGTMAEQFEVSDYGDSRFTPEVMQAVGEQWAEKIRREIAERADEDESSQNDTLGIKERLYRRHPKLYERVENGGKLDVTVDVKVDMKRVHVLDREI